VDGWFSFATNEPNLLKVKNIATYVFLLADFGYPLVSETYVVTTDSLKNKRKELKAMLKADIMGWHENLKDPALGARLAATKYGKDQNLDEAEQTLESRAENDLILTPDTKANGLFTITPQLIDENIQTLTYAGINITKDKLFDMSLLDEVYQENPALKTSPV
jgi:ABC-type nitrate/sulfonate/bicarbonate transport system substrate-binding protein